MKGVYNKVKKLDLSQWIVTKFYHYTSRAKDVFAEYDPTWHQKPWGDPYLKELYEHFLKCADAYLNYPEISFASLGHQNKTTIEVFNIFSGEKFYITQYDGTYSLGRSVWSEYGTVTEFGIKEKII